MTTENFINPLLFGAKCPNPQCDWYPHPGGIIPCDNFLTSPFYCPKCWSRLTFEEKESAEIQGGPIGVGI